MTSIDEIENHIKPFLLSSVNFLLDGKKIKSGKLILFSVRDFFCIFTLQDAIKNKKVIYEIPYPFSLHSSPKSLIFDYTVDSFCEKSTGIHNIIKDLNFKKTSKLFDKKLVIQQYDDTITCG
jgi:hypothetical protein